jgi:small subunit ribosomal protein S8
VKLDCFKNKRRKEMTVTDPIADMLTRIRNGAQAAHETVDIPASNLKLQLAKVLKEEGYIENYEEKEDGKFKVLSVTLKYDAKKKPVITKLVRVSKPGLRTYSKAKNLQKVLGGLGVAIVSTSKGLMTDRKARKENIGGEVLCYIY